MKREGKYQLVETEETEEGESSAPLGKLTEEQIHKGQASRRCGGAKSAHLLPSRPHSHLLNCAANSVKRMHRRYSNS